MDRRDDRTREPNQRSRKDARKTLAMLAMAAVLGLLGLPAAMAATHLPKNNHAHDVTVTETNFGFSPDHLTWTAGETVRLTLKNTSKKAMGVHGFLMGKGLAYSKSKSSKRHPDGWKTYLLGSDTKIAWGMGKDITQFQQGAPGEAVLKPGGQVVLQFKVPDKPGTWHFASFQHKGDDYAKGMKGTITIQPAKGNGRTSGGS